MPLECTTGNWLAHNSLGMALSQRGRWPEALKQYRECLEIEPGYLDAQVNAAAALVALGRKDEAAAQYRAAMQTAPTTPKECIAPGQFPPGRRPARRGDRLLSPGIADQSALRPAYNNIADLLRQQGRDDDAIAEYEQVLRLDPSCVEARCSLGTVLARRGRIDDAIEQYRQARTSSTTETPRPIIIWPWRWPNAGSLTRPSAIFVRRRNSTRGLPRITTGSAARWKRKAIPGKRRPSTARRSAIRRDSLNAMNNLAWLLATSPNPSLRNATEAIRLARRANELSAHRRPDVLDTLAAAYAEAGQFGEALAAARRALNLAQQQHQPSLAEHLAKANQVVRSRSCSAPGGAVQPPGPPMAARAIENCASVDVTSAPKKNAFRRIGGAIDGRVAMASEVRQDCVPLALPVRWAG